MIKTRIVRSFLKENFTETFRNQIWQDVKGEACEYSHPSSLPRAVVVYSYYEKGCRRKCARDHPER